MISIVVFMSTTLGTYINITSLFSELCAQQLSPGEIHSVYIIAWHFALLNLFSLSSSL